MRDYIVRKMSQQQTIIGTRIVRCDCDSDAVSVAYATTYAAPPDCYAVEVWDSGRMVARVACQFNGSIECSPVGTPMGAPMAD